MKTMFYTSSGHPYGKGGVFRMMGGFNLPFLKRTSDSLSENKCMHTYYLRTL